MERDILGESRTGDASVEINNWLVKSKSLLLLHSHEEVEVSWFADRETEAQRDGDLLKNTQQTKAGIRKLVSFF